MFGNLHINNSNVSYDILQYYNSIFINQVQSIIDQFKKDEIVHMKKRKLSMPDDIKVYHFEKDSAFSNETNLYEPLKKTIFYNDTLSFSSSRFTNNKLISQSALCSPLVNKSSMSATGLSRTPRAMKVASSYLEIEETNTPQISKVNVFKGRILERLNSGFSRSALGK
jgi:hypothetical protein